VGTGNQLEAVFFALLALCATLAILSKNTAAAVSVGLIGSISAGLGGYISRTFLRAQETAASQLRAYFHQPLEFSRYLVADRL